MINYIIYSTDNKKVKREIIKLNDIYPFAYAHNRLPKECTTIATISNKPCYQCESTFWHKYNMITEKTKDLWDNKQSEFKKYN